MTDLEKKSDVEELHLLVYPHDYILSLLGEEKDKTFLELANKLKALEIIKQLKIVGEQNIIEVQGQWYFISGTIFNKANKIPITEEQAYILMEVLK